MIEYAGYGIAVANASISLKEKADYITLSNDEDGIAYAFANILDIKSWKNVVKCVKYIGCLLQKRNKDKLVHLHRNED